MLIGIVITRIYESSLPLLEKYAVTRAESAVAETVCDAAAQLGLSDISNFELPGNGGLEGVISDAGKLNRLRSEALRRISDDLDNNRIRVSIPLGSLCGSPVLSGSGPPLTAYFDGCTAVSADFVYDNTPVGVNSGCCIISMRVTVRSTLVFPKGKTSDVDVNVDIPVERIIITSKIR